MARQVLEDSAVPAGGWTAWRRVRPTAGLRSGRAWTTEGEPRGAAPARAGHAGGERGHRGHRRGGTADRVGAGLPDLAALHRHVVRADPGAGRARADRVRQPDAHLGTGGDHTGHAGGRAAVPAATSPGGPAGGGRVRRQRCREGSDAPAVPVVPREVGLLARLVVGLAAATLVLGTVVAGSGPHAGDAKAARTGLDPGVVAQ